METQFCCTCKQELPLSVFRNDKNRKNGKSAQCKGCRSIWYEANKETQRAKGREWHKKNPERSRRNSKNAQLRSDFGITLAEYENMFNIQQGLCQICKEPSTILLSVDHCHKTGKVRGLLCSKCNFGLGQFKDRIDLLLTAVNYLKEAES